MVSDDLREAGQRAKHEAADRKESGKPAQRMRADCEAGISSDLDKSLAGPGTGVKRKSFSRTKTNTNKACASSYGGVGQTKQRSE